jgi:hypothetical protein
MWNARYIQDITAFFFYCLILLVIKLLDMLYCFHGSYAIPSNANVHYDHAQISHSLAKF